jgi:predicted Asp-tRNA(Asn)/Glu-tRNA(Gln) amidotransferase subunit C
MGVFVMESFLWHRVSKEEQERIKKEAKSIMDSFSKALEKVEGELAEGFEVKREEQLRDETSTKTDKKFRKNFFENAPSKSQDYIRAEKGKWK